MTRSIHCFCHGINSCRRVSVQIGTNSFSHAYDNNGNITMYIDESSNVIAAYEYDDFGRTISQPGSLADLFRHRFSTKYYDPETSLYYYGYRFYSPQLMRWLNRDPIEEQSGKNLYMYREKLFQFGYFVYKLSGRKGNYERISSNPDMYTAWSVGGATRLLPNSDISESGIWINVI